MLNSKKSIRYRTGRYFSYRSVNRYRNSYVCTGLTGENRVFGPVKKKPEKHTTKKEKKPRRCYRHRFQPCNLLCFSFLQYCFSFTAFFLPLLLLLLLLLCFTCFSCECTEHLAGRHAKFISFLFSTLTSALLNAKVKKYIYIHILRVSF